MVLAGKLETRIEAGPGPAPRRLQMVSVDADGAT